MPQLPVSIAIHITDHVSNQVTQNLSVLGHYDPDASILRYTEPDESATVTLTLRDHSATLLRQGPWTTRLEFDPNGHFEVESEQGLLSGDLKLLTYDRTETSAHLEYRLFGPQGELAHTTLTLSFRGPLS